MSDDTTSQSGQDQTWQQAQPTESIGSGAPDDAKAKEEHETREALDELKAALAQLAAAATRVGHIAQVKVREEWKTTKPELQKTIEEMKRGVEAAATRASSTLDNLAKKVDKPGPTQDRPDAPEDGQPRQPEPPEQQAPPRV